MNLKLSLTRRIAISIGLGLVLAHVAHAEPIIQKRTGLYRVRLDVAGAGVSP